MNRRQWLIVVAAILLLTLVPYGALLVQLPWGPDATKWIDRGSLDYAGWWSWLVNRQHFIGYRPVTALTFFLNWLTTGYAPWGYRLTDLFLHVGSAFALFDLHRVLSRDRGLWGLLAVLLLCAHPATEEVVPFVARRSYLLSACFGLPALAVLVRGLRSHIPWPHYVVSGLLITLAALSNEGAYVLVPMVPLLALHERWEQGPRPMLVTALQSSAPVALFVTAALVKRWMVLGSLSGGYHKRYFAFLKNGVPHWRDMKDGVDPLAIFAACWRYTLAPNGVMGSAAILDGTPGLVVTVCLGVLLVLVTVVRPVWRRHDPRARLLGLLGMWLVGATVIVVASQTWFWRQAYFLLPPLGILIAMLAKDAVAAAQARRWEGLTLVPLVLVMLGAVATGPLAGGLHLGANYARVRHAPLANQTRGVIEQLPHGTTVYLVVPTHSAASHMIRLWADRWGKSKDTEFRVLANVRAHGDAEAASASFGDLNGIPRLQLDGEELQWAKDQTGTVKLRAHHKLLIDKLWSDKEPRAVVILSHDGPTWRLVPLPKKRREPPTAPAPP